MNTNHIDQLAQWYADAEQVTKTNLPRKGDTLIYPRRTSGYIIESDGGGWIPDLVHSTGETVRILSRAPKPVPAWHDAPAVIAHTGIRDRRVFVNALDGEWLDADTGALLRADTLQAPVPLIEAKVTDEMVKRAKRRFRQLESELPYVTSGWVVQEVLAAALNIDPSA